MLSANDKLFINETVTKAIEENNKVLLKRFDNLEKSIKALSVTDNAVAVSKPTTSTTSKIMNITMLKRLDSEDYKALSNTVKKFHGKQDKSAKLKDKDNKPLVRWTFTESDGRNFANYVVDKKVLGNKKLTNWLVSEVK